MGVELADGDPVRAPDGTWCFYQAKTRMPRSWGASELEVRSELSGRLGSFQEAYDLMCSAPGRWEVMLAGIEEPGDVRALRRRLGPALNPMPPIKPPAARPDWVYGRNGGLPLHPPGEGEDEDEPELGIKAGPSAAPAEGGAPAAPAPSKPQRRGRGPGKKDPGPVGGPKLHELVRLYHGEGMKVEAAAEAMGLKVSTARSYLSKASGLGICPPITKQGQSLNREAPRDPYAGRRKESLTSRTAEYLRLRDAGKSMNKAAEIMGVSFRRVRQLEQSLRSASDRAEGPVQGGVAVQGGPSSEGKGSDE